MIQLTRDEQWRFEQARLGNWDPFTEYYFQLPMSGTWFTPEDRVEIYEVMRKAWRVSGRPDQVFSAVVDNVETEIVVSWDVSYYGNEPLFLVRHGFRILDWIREFLNPAISNGIAITGTGSGKTGNAAIFGLMCCAVFPGFRFLNVAPSAIQANLMLGEIEKWCSNTLFTQFIRPSRGAHPLWKEESGYPTITVEVYEGYPSTFVCQTVGGSATNVLGGERDCINCDEAQLLTGIDEAIPILATRLRGTRSTGELRWTMLRWISNPGKNPELLALMDYYRELEDDGNAIVLEDIDSDVNIYVTQRQLRQQKLSLASQRAIDRWHGGSMAATLDSSLEDLVNGCRSERLDALVQDGGSFDDAFGLMRYELKYDQERSYIVLGDSGKMNITSMSANNAPCVGVFDMTDFPAGPAPMAAFYWFDGEGSYATFAGVMKHAMTRYRAASYYDATNVQTALEDMGKGSFDGWPTTPVLFSGTAMVKRWALAVITQLLHDRKLEFPYIKALWHQARVYEVDSRNKPDDIIAMLLILALAFRIEGTLWDKIAELYDWNEYEEAFEEIEDDSEMEDDTYESVVVVRDRHARCI